MTYLNNLYLIVSAIELLMLGTGFLWPGDVFKPWRKVNVLEAVFVPVMTACSFVPGFTWEVRGLLLAVLAVSWSLFLRQLLRRAE